MRLFNNRRARALQHQLERYERDLQAGSDPAEARARLSATLGSDARLFHLAAGLPATRAEIPEPEFAAAFAARLRRAEVRPAPVARVRAERRPRFSMSLAPLAVAASVLLAAGVLVPAANSLPGDGLYSVKSFGEDARLFVSSGSGEARLRVKLARLRFQEVEDLVERSRLQAFVPGLNAAGQEAEIEDPRIARLIEETLENASHHLEVAAEILIEERSSSEDLEELMSVAQEGRELASKVAEDMPQIDQPPVLHQAVQMAKIEAKARAARESVVIPTPEPCPTPTATPQTTPTPTPEPTPEPTPTPEATPTPTPDPDATPDPCPTPTPEPTPETADEQDPSPSPSPSPASDEAVEQRESGDSAKTSGLESRSGTASAGTP